MLESDIYRTADGEIVVSHDATADRTTDGSGAIGIGVDGIMTDRPSVLESVIHDMGVAY